MKPLFIGHSHMGALIRGWRLMSVPGVEPVFISLYEAPFLNRKPGSPVPTGRPGAAPSDVDFDKLAAELRKYRGDANQTVYLLLNGSQHSDLAFAVRGYLSLLWNRRRWAGAVKQRYLEWFSRLKGLIPAEQCLVLLSPPPAESETWIRTNAGVLESQIKGRPLLKAKHRLNLWKAQCELIRAAARHHGLAIHELPASIFSPSGFLAEDCRRPDDVTHANQVHGQRVLQTLIPAAASHPIKMPPTNPYSRLRRTAYWRTSVTEVPSDAVDPVVRPRFAISISDRVATAGSCFAQHISRRLMSAGCGFMRMETDDAGAEPYAFSARYGNVYTARQLLQLFDRAFGHFQPSETAWLRADGRYCDPFRPQVDSAGFESAAAVQDAAQLHLKAVREMFSQLDVLVFTLGLTECFVGREDGAVYPVAPGVSGGAFDENKYRFVNFSVHEVTSDLTQFLGKLRKVNPKARVILTVSPVPLVATRSADHVLVASSYSKAVLRVAAGNIEARFRHVYYFPSYEIITGPHASGTYYESDRRSVAPEGVDHVMRIFMSRMVQQTADTQEQVSDMEPEQVSAVTPSPPAGRETALQRTERLTAIACDEELNDAGLRR